MKVSDIAKNRINLMFKCNLDNTLPMDYIPFRSSFFSFNLSVLFLDLLPSELLSELPFDRLDNSV